RNATESFASYPWQIYVVKSDASNAFSAGAGTVFITNGLIRRLHSESELAAIISHEMSHTLLGHVREAIAQSGNEKRPRFVFTLDHELAADSLGLRILEVAGYDPRAALQAVADSYRGREEPSDREREWIGLRTASLQGKLSEIPPGLPATEN